MYSPLEATGCFINITNATACMLNVRFRAYLSKYKEDFNRIWSGGVVGATPWKI